MKTALLSATACVLLLAGASFPATAHTNYDLRKQHPHGFAASAPDQMNVLAPRFDAPLHGPTNDALSTATGGPAGGLPDRS